MGGSTVVVKISEVELSPDKIKLLSNGLKFAPQPLRINWFQFKQDIKDFRRTLRLQEFFFNPNKNDGGEYDRDARCFKPASM